MELIIVEPEPEPEMGMVTDAGGGAAAAAAAGSSSATGAAFAAGGEPEPERAMGAGDVIGSAAAAGGTRSGGAAVTPAGAGRLGGRVMTPRLLPTAEAGLPWTDNFESSDEEGGGAQLGEGVPVGSHRLRPARNSSSSRGLTTAAGIQQPQVQRRDRATTRIPSTVSDPARAQPRRKSCEYTSAPSPLSNLQAETAPVNRTNQFDLCCCC